MFNISKPALSRFRNGEYLQFMTTVLDLYKASDSKSLLLEDRVNEFERTINIMKEAFMGSKGDIVSSELRPMDEERISLVKGLKRFLQSEYYRPDVQKKKQASLLLKSFARFCDGIEKLSFQHKTVVITKMLDEWSTEPGFPEAISTTGANSWVTELTAQNEAFYANYFLKVRSNLPVAQSNKMKADIKVVFDDLITDTTAYARVSSDKAQYNKLIKELTSVIDANNYPVNNRRNRKRKETIIPSYPALPTGVLELNSY